NGAIANLSIISYTKLLSNDPAETARLVSACRDWGFFRLDLMSTEAESYRKTVADLNEISREYFDQPLADKLKDTCDEWGVFNICGYKPRSLDFGNVEGKKDGCEGLRIPADLFLMADPNKDLQIPQALHAQQHTVRSFVRNSHAIAVLVLERLSTGLGLSGSSSLESFHRPDKASTATAVLQHYPFEGDLPEDTSAGHFAHTDAGSISILFNSEWGLQVCSPHSENWEYVPPALGTHAIVNIGDTVKFLSGRQLKSCLHRVVPCPEKWTKGPRYSTIFFLRANDDAEFEDMRGQRWNAQDWLNRKFLNYRSPHDVQMKTPTATGREGFVGLWE
ncbi:2OG-Fe(II) oxygenase family oxidoreductase, partial [Thozetella sp. PMI_491]